MKKTYHYRIGIVRTLSNISDGAFLLNALHKKMKFSIKDVFRKQRIWSHLLKKSLMENFIICAVKPLIISGKGSTANVS